MSSLSLSLCAAALLGLAMAALPLAAPNLTNVRDCGSTGTVVDAMVEGCEQAPCQVVRGENVTVNIRFRPGNRTEVLRPEVVGRVSEFEVPIAELDHDDGCERLLVGSCPFEENQEGEYTTSFVLEPDFPKIKGEVRWLLWDENNSTVVCIAIDAEAV